MNGAEGAGGFAAECRIAVDAAERAGALLRSRFRQEHRVRPKGGHGDVVTDLDLLAEDLVVARIRESFPRDRILAEEAGLLDGDRPGRTWLVDPLDGSNNVVIGLAAYVVGIALCVEEQPVVGVVHDPVSGGTWRALRGGGAYGPHGRISGAAGGLPSGGLPSGGLPSGGPVLAWTQGHGVARDDPGACGLKAALEAGSRRLLQLWAPLLTWSLLARGGIDGFVGYRPEEIDLPAGSLLAAEAGLEVRRLDGGEYSHRIGRCAAERSFVAARPGDIGYLLDVVARAGTTP
ncbi:inositol monophosphatase [Streptomyces sp. SP17BM10]|uniref:inositol monophosphatase family protein n=1 Tax=Streptomyces sp. SP17BM10 TaxID=3002530 RepID=UPI002E76531D|nr:inositol monophosphatase [Streptomyces sp. SP17BM10]MEE1782184.1 inositol monophosphatase [Streptomyces sp. SP17BM10]